MEFNRRKIPSCLHCIPPNNGFLKILPKEFHSTTGNMILKDAPLISG